MSLKTTKQYFLGFVTAALVGPAVALLLGYPDAVCKGLGTPHAEWIKAKTSQFGLYAYTVSDLILGAVCGAALLAGDEASADFALASMATHQAGYLAAAIPAFGWRNDYLGSVIFGGIAGVWAMFYPAKGRA